jgi:hypothetical protein
MRRVVFFPHSKKEFGSKYRLRNWLSGTLRIDNDGIYLLKKHPGLSDLDAGSIVFFVREDSAVGCAVVEEDMKEITEEERKVNDYGPDYKWLVKFVPNSIWAWSDSQFLSRQKLKEITGKEVGMQGYTQLDDLGKLMEIYAEIKAPKPIRELGGT